MRACPKLPTILPLIDARVTRTAHPDQALDHSVESAASLVRLPDSSPRRSTMPGLCQTRVELERVAFFKRDLRKPRIGAVDDQVVFGRLDIGRDHSASSAPASSHRSPNVCVTTCCAPVGRQSGGLRGPNHQAVGQLEPEQGLSDRRECRSHERASRVAPARDPAQ